MSPFAPGAVTLAVMHVLLLLLLRTATNGVAAVAFQAASDLDLFKPGRQTHRYHTTSGAKAIGSIELTPETVETSLGRTDSSQQQPRGRTLTAKRKRRSLFRPDRPSDYVSLGHVRSFSGDVYPPANLAAALGARSFRREVVLLTDTRPRAAVQLYDNLAQLGLTHVLWLTGSEGICSVADKLLAARADLRRQQLAKEQQQGASPVVGAVAGASGQRALRAAKADFRRARDLLDAQTSISVSVNVSATMTALASANDAAARGRRNSIYGIAGAGALATTAADIGCVWCNQPFPEAFAGHRRLMMKRVMLLLRIVRQGFNVLSLDTDVIVFREPYSFFKHPPYSSAHMVAGKSIRGGSIVNTGVMYFQNVSRSGPVVWLLTDVVERNLLWLQPRAEAEVQLLTPVDADKRGCWDQLLFADSVLTSISGKLSLYYCARPPDRLAAGRSGRPEDESGGWNSRHRAALGLPDRQGPGELMTREVTSVSDPNLLSLAADDSFMTSWANLTIPRNPPPLLAEEPGYRLPPRQPGDLVAQLQQLLQADDKQAWLQAPSGSTRRLRGAAPERLTELNAARLGGEAPQEARRQLQQMGSSSSSGDSAQQSLSSDQHLPLLYRDVEMLAYAADWLVGGWTQRGVLGYWDPALTNGVPRQVFAHLVRAPGPTSIGKEAVRMQYGEYDWELAALTDGGPFPFLGSGNASEVPRVVALLPDVDTTTNTPVQWSNMARGLAQIAVLTGRRVVWPAVPCASKWVQPNPGSRRALPLNANLRFLAHGSFSAGLMCTPATAMHQKCLYERVLPLRNDTTTVPRDEMTEVIRRDGPRGLLPAEFEMLLRVLPPEVGRPGPHNTVHLQTNDDYDDGGGERPVMFDEPPRTEGIAYVKASAVAQPLRTGSLAAQPVLYLAQRTFLTQLDKLGEPDLMARYRAFRNECPALK